MSESTGHQRHWVLCPVCGAKTRLQLLQETELKAFMKKNPALEDTCDTVLSLLSGSFALLAVGFVWIKELVGRKKSQKD